jgi:hypothetical protein
MKNLLSWLKENIGLAVGALISLGVLGYIGYSLVYVNFDKDASVTARLDEKRAEMDGLRRRKPYPHVDNVVILSNTVAALSGTNVDFSVARWLTNLAGVNPPPQNIKPSVFNTKLVQYKNKLLAAARKCNVAVPQDFGFGFARYVTLGTPPANDPAQIHTLLTQWSAVEMMTEILLTNHISSIAAIRRAPVGVEIPRDANMPGAPMAATGEDSKDFFTASVRDNPAEITRVLPFELEFVADTQALRGILSALETSPRFFVVRSLAVLNARSGEMLQGGRSESMGKDVAAAAAAAAAAAGGGAAAARPGTVNLRENPVTVFGLEKIQVKLRVDLVEFREPSAPAAK